VSTLAGVPDDQRAELAPDDQRAALAADVRRVSDRLRTLSAARLAAAPGPSVAGGQEHSSRAAAGRHAAQLMADAAAALEAVALGVPAERRTLPVLPDLAVGDQVAVTGHDLLTALADAAGAAGAADADSAAGGLSSVDRAVRDAATALADVRRRL
jgi:hypothetical protein